MVNCSEPNLWNFSFTVLILCVCLPVATLNRLYAIHESQKNKNIPYL